MSTPQQPGQGQPPFGAQPGQFGQPGQQGQFGQPAPQAPGQFGQPGQFPGQGGPAAGQGPAFPAAGQGPAFPASGQGTGFPQQGQQFGPAGGGGGFGPAMPPGGGRMRRVGRIAGRALMIRLIVFGVVLVVGLVVWLVTRGSDPGNAAVGDCIGNLPTVNSTTAVDANDAKKIDCTDPGAQYKVIGVKNDPSGDEINNSDQVDKDCSAYPGYQTAFEQYSQDNSGNDSDGTLLCLEPVKH